MSKKLGIENDNWHLLIPLFVQLILIPVFGLFLLTPSLVVLAIVLLVFILFTLQFINEWNQLVDTDLSCKKFKLVVANSRKDTKLFIIGLFGGLFLGLLAFGILYKILEVWRC